jgi:hypothetical protein
VVAMEVRGVVLFFEHELPKKTHGHALSIL